jgi:hypothetical protein
VRKHGTFSQAALEERFCQKMESLRTEQSSLKDETKANEELGRQLAAQVLQLAQPNECEKFKLHVDEIDKITSLLYGLSGRLAKAEHSLDTWPVESDADGKVRCSALLFPDQSTKCHLCLFRTNSSTKGISWSTK